MNPGDRLGKYEIVEVLGRGAMGVVYRAHDPDIQRTVAIKTIRKDLVDDHERAAMMFARFRNEARAAGRLSHPGIVAVHDYGDTGELTYIAMEFVQGMSLREYFNRGTRFPEHDIISIMAQLLEGLQHAHEQGVWHRDIKPANLIIMHNGRVKIADFGIAKVDSSQLTQTGLVLGSPGFMAPEQFSGGAVDWRADLFAAGVVMYQLLTGLRAFTGTTEQLAYKICHVTPPPPSEADPGRGWERYDAVLARALAKETDARFQTAESFRAAILAAYAAPVNAAVSEETIINEATASTAVFEPSNPSAHTFPESTPPPAVRPIVGPHAPPAAAVSGAVLTPLAAFGRWPIVAGAAAGLLAIGAVVGFALRTGGETAVAETRSGAAVEGTPRPETRTAERTAVAAALPADAPEATKAAAVPPEHEPPKQAKPAASPPTKSAPTALPDTAPSARTAALAPAPKPAPPRPAEGPTGFWRDQGITTKVASKLQFNRKLWRTGIQVETKEGVVTLRGNIPSQALINEAVNVAKGVYGVRAVRNELKVGAPDYSSAPGATSP
jgi:serine/threonine-protein kinase